VSLGFPAPAVLWNVATPRRLRSGSWTGLRSSTWTATARSAPVRGRTHVTLGWFAILRARTFVRGRRRRRRTTELRLASCRVSKRWRRRGRAHMGTPAPHRASTTYDPGLRPTPDCGSGVVAPLGGNVILRACITCGEPSADRLRRRRRRVTRLRLVVRALLRRARPLTCTATHGLGIPRPSVHRDHRKQRGRPPHRRSPPGVM
jgi:hypothetical protein